MRISTAPPAPLIASALSASGPTGPYQTDGRRVSSVKFKNPEYSQMEARHELFQASRQGKKARTHLTNAARTSASECAW